MPLELMTSSSGPRLRSSRVFAFCSSWGLVLVLVLASCTCEGDSPGETLEECASFEADDEEPLPRLELEQVYDVRLRDHDTDPAYREGIRKIFVDSDGIAVFGNGSFVRASIDGTSIGTPVPYGGIGLPQRVRQADGFYGATVFREASRADFCIFDSSGIIQSCSLAISTRFAWKAPNFYFPYASSRESPTSTIDLRIVDSSGVETGVIHVLDQDGEHPDGLALEAIGDHFALIKAFNDPLNGGCTGVGVARVGENINIEDAHWEYLLAPSHEIAQSALAASGPRTVAVPYRVEYCKRTTFECAIEDSQKRRFPMLTLIDDEAGTHTQVLGDHVFGITIWDGEYFAILKLFDGEYRITQVKTDGTIVGTVSWPTELFISVLGEVGFAAIGPGDYAIVFSIAGLEPQDRLVRVRVSPPQ